MDPRVVKDEAVNVKAFSRKIKEEALWNQNHQQLKGPGLLMSPYDSSSHTSSHGALLAPYSQLEDLGLFQEV